jgi:hypothetical protein
MTHPFSSDEIAQSSRALLSDLEASLADGQQALLARDFTRMEQCTRQQIDSHQALAILWRQGIADPASVPGLRPAQLRVLHAARVQAALLERAQRWLRTLANLVAGPASNYSPPIFNGRAPHLAPYLAWPSADRPTHTDTTLRAHCEDGERKGEDRDDKEHNRCPA